MQPRHWPAARRGLSTILSSSRHSHSVKRWSEIDKWDASLCSYFSHKSLFYRFYIIHEHEIMGGAPWLPSLRIIWVRRQKANKGNQEPNSTHTHQATYNFSSFNNQQSLVKHDVLPLFIWISATKLALHLHILWQKATLWSCLATCLMQCPCHGSFIFIWEEDNELCCRRKCVI